MGTTAQAMTIDFLILNFLERRRRSLRQMAEEFSLTYHGKCSAQEFCARIDFLVNRKLVLIFFPKSANASGSAFIKLAPSIPDDIAEIARIIRDIHERKK